MSKIMMVGVITTPKGEDKKQKAFKDGLEALAKKQSGKTVSYIRLLAVDAETDKPYEAGDSNAE